MAQLGINFQNIAPDEGRETIPAGWYNVMADESEMKPVKDSNNKFFLVIRFTVLDGQFKGRKLFSRFNLQNDNQQTVEIAYRQLSAVAHAVGILQVQDSSQLHGIPLKVKVKVKPAEGQYDEQNEITSYKNINYEVPAAQAGGASTGGWQPPQGGFQPPATVAPPTAAAPAAQPPQHGWTPPAAAPAAAPAPVTQPWAQPQGAAPAAPPAQPPQQPQQPAWAAQPPQGAPAAAPAAAPANAPQQPGAPVPPWAQPKQ